MNIHTNSKKLPGIYIQNLWKSFDDRHILSGVCLDIPKGESFVLMGPSGTGKSVLLKSVLGLIAFDKGHVLFGKKPRSKMMSFLQGNCICLQQTGVVLQSCGLFDSLTVLENVAFKALRLFSRPKALKMAKEALSHVGLCEKIGQLYPNEISGGMKRRVSLARAILLKPFYLFFDEPTSGMDPVASHIISDLIRRVITDLGATALTITHDIQTAKIVGDQAGLLYDGHIVWQGDASTLSNCTDEKLRQFVEGSIDGPLKII